MSTYIVYFMLVFSASGDVTTITDFIGKEECEATKVQIVKQTVSRAYCFAQAKESQ